MDTFLDKFYHEKTKVTVCITDATYFTGIIKGFNDTAIWLSTKYHELVIVNRNLITYIYEE
ncbi:MAG: hypothetical protein DDT29_00871 [Dehalococcoidia bacterium]|nr:hypothetical protein [Bacillota bacterium]